MKKVILLSVVILLISSGFAFAEVPCKINYQGRLIKDNVPVDGTKTMVFSIYDSAVGGTQLWTSEDVDITVHNGLFRYVLDLSSIDWTAGQTLYLEVKVEADILTPREELSAYPYAINSHLLEGETKEYFLNTSVDTQTKQGNLNIMGNVGIGTTGPTEELHVVGTAQVGKVRGTTADGTSDLEGLKIIRRDNSGMHGIFFNSNVGDTAGQYWENMLIYNSGGGSKIGFWTGPTATERMRITADGNVGIGTTSPGAKLDVQGGAIKATGGLIIETRTSDPASPATGQMWLRTD